MTPKQTISLSWGVRHRHESGTDFPMRPDDGTFLEHPPEETTTVVACDDCGTEALVDIHLTSDLTGLERLDLLTAVANASNAGHIPPDHRFGLPVPESCPLCTALGALSDPLPGES